MNRRNDFGMTEWVDSLSFIIIFYILHMEVWKLTTFKINCSTELTSVDH